MILAHRCKAMPAPDITENYIRWRVRDPGEFNLETFVTYELSAKDGIKAVMGKLKGGRGTMVVQSYLFDKKKWTVEKARTWIREHKK